MSRDCRYLGDEPVAIRERDATTNLYTTRYQHNDGLGSALVETDANRAVLTRTEYEPYGLSNRPTLDGPGFTGHVQDAATGLAYMQQRYYDPVLGRFLSVDPVSAYSNGDWRFFNRYTYAFNNPYRFVDPDGRCSGPVSGPFYNFFGLTPIPDSERDPRLVQADAARGRSGQMVLGGIATSAVAGGACAVGGCAAVVAAGRQAMIGAESASLATGLGGQSLANTASNTASTMIGGGMLSMEGQWIIANPDKVMAFVSGVLGEMAGVSSPPGSVSDAMGGWTVSAIKSYSEWVNNQNRPDPSEGQKKLVPPKKPEPDQEPRERGRYDEKAAKYCYTNSIFSVWSYDPLFSRWLRAKSRC